MKITRIEKFKVVVPGRPGTASSPEFEKIDHCKAPVFIVRVHTDAGLAGVGETPRGVPDEEIDQGISALLGKDPMAMNLQALPVNRWSRAYVAFEGAIFDIVGKATERPAYMLLGGVFRDKILMNWWIGRQSPEDTARIAKKGWDMGFRSFKLKCALEDPNVERVAAIAEVTPDMQIVLDPNTRFRRFADAVRLARQLEGYNIACFEDPIPKWNPDWYAMLRQKLDIPIALHLGRPQDVIMAIKREAADYFCLGGSMVNFVKMASIAQAANIPVWHGAGLNLGILGWACNAHASAAAENCVLPGDGGGSQFVREDDLVLNAPPVQGGHMAVPQGPGLGVELDEEALERYTVSRGEGRTD